MEIHNIVEVSWVLIKTMTRKILNNQELICFHGRLGISENIPSLDIEDEIKDK